MDELESVREEYLALRERTEGALLATLEDQQIPAASYAPLVWVDGCSYLFISDLAAHTRNLKRCASISLLLIDEVGNAGNAFARQRISLQGEAQMIERDDPLFAPVLAEFQRRFGEVVSLLESLPDFHLFALNLQTGRYIRGFGQAFELSGERLDQLAHIHPGK
jgi:putative heme iron utilization protein